MVIWRLQSRRPMRGGGHGHPATAEAPRSPAVRSCCSIPLHAALHHHVTRLRLCLYPSSTLLLLTPDPCPCPPCNVKFRGGALCVCPRPAQASVQSHSASVDREPEASEARHCAAKQLRTDSS